jgi:hypothetical protein
MSWNYRIMRHKHPSGEYYQIHEVFYEPMGWSADPIEPFGSTPDELIECLEIMLSDAKKCKDDILDYDSLGESARLIASSQSANPEPAPTRRVSPGPIQRRITNWFKPVRRLANRLRWAWGQLRRRKNTLRG